MNFCSPQPSNIPNIEIVMNNFEVPKRSESVCRSAKNDDNLLTAPGKVYGTSDYASSKSVKKYVFSTKLKNQQSSHKMGALLGPLSQRAYNKNTTQIFESKSDRAADDQQGISKVDTRNILEKIQSRIDQKNYETASQMRAGSSVLQNDES